MITMAQRLEELRTQRGLSRPALAAALGLPRMSVEKFETGRQTPSQEQQAKMASYFGVSLSYLRGETNDPKDMDDWMDGAFLEEPAPAPAAPAPRPKKPTAAAVEQGSMFDAFLNSKKFQESLRAAVLDVLRSPDGKELLEKAVRRQMDARKSPAGSCRTKNMKKRPGDLLSGPSLIAERFECGSESFERGPDMLLAPPASACPGGQPRIPGGPVPGPPVPVRQRE